MSIIRKAWQPFANLLPRQWAWAHFKAALVAFMVVYSFFTPEATITALGQTRYAWISIAIIGALVSIVGVIMGAQAGLKWQKYGPKIEFYSLIALAVGPLGYFTTLALIAIQGDVENASTRWGPAVLGYVALSAVIVRMAEVWPRFRRANLLEEIP